MDDIVLQAMLRWPNVPAVYGWLKLDRQGRWLIKNAPIANPTINEFIGRNYTHNDSGQWYFQNGPQRVFVELEYTPYSYRVWRCADGTFAANTHTGLALTQPSHCWFDNDGNILIDCEHGIGCVEGQSLAALVDAFCDENGLPCADQTIETLFDTPELAKTIRLCWNTMKLPVGLINTEQVANRFGLDPSPQPPEGQMPC